MNKFNFPLFYHSHAPFCHSERSEESDPISTGFFAALRMTKRALLFFMGLLIFSACEKNNPAPPETESKFETGTGVFIFNEGGFTHGNASVSFYDFDSKTVSEKIFETENNLPLGDVLQSITRIGENLFLVLNNSGKIEVVNAETFASVATIDGLTSPRYLAEINSEKAYVTDLASNHISIINTQTFEKIGQISLPGQTEELVKIGIETFVTNRTTEFVYIINNQSNTIADSIQVSHDPNTLRADKNGHFWVLCNGNQITDKPAGIFKIDPISRQVLNEFLFEDFQIGIWPRLRINGTGDAIYFIKNSIYKMEISATELPNEPLINAESGSVFYGLGIDPNTEDIYVADALDYQQKGIVFRFDSEGNALDSFRAGIIPNGFLFN